MRIFVMWSGDGSRRVGEAAGELLRLTLSGAKVFISPQTPAGSLWKDEITKNLQEANIGIACFTRENLENPWMHYESGMIAKMPDNRLCPLRIGLEHITGPLEDRQSTDASDKEAVFHLVSTLNSDRPRTQKKTESLLRTEFDHHWKDFSAIVQSVLCSRLERPAKGWLKEFTAFYEARAADLSPSDFLFLAVARCFMLAATHGNEVARLEPEWSQNPDYWNRRSDFMERVGLLQRNESNEFVRSLLGTAIDYLALKDIRFAEAAKAMRSDTQLAGEWHL